VTAEEAFRFDGKRALVVGGATGMGAATAALVQDLGAEVVVMDLADVTLDGAPGIKVDLRHKNDIDDAVEACEGPLHAVFGCAGVADGTPGIEKVNFIGHRHLLDRLLERDMLPPGAAIGMISSAAGLGWQSNLKDLLDYLDTPDFDAASAWIEAHPEKADYLWSKQTINAYVARQAFPLLRRGIRINAIMPGPTNTPLARANATVWLTFGEDFRAEVGLAASTPEEQAYPLVFLCSDAARYITGQSLVTDAGYLASGITESYPPAKPAADFLYGRM
jgi:NAD(P)-dependent dehydrogenase (short-subunit alcohol dehydrogenase family)